MNEVQKYLQNTKQLQGKPLPNRWQRLWHRILCHYGKHDIKGHLHRRGDNCKTRAKRLRNADKQHRVKVQCTWCGRERWLDLEKQQPLVPQATMARINKRMGKRIRQQAREAQ